MTVESLQQRAEDHLQFIREAMQRASSFTAIPGWGGVLMGTTALVAAVLAARSSGEQQWLQIWLADAAVAVPLGAVTMAHKARRVGVDLARGTGRLFVFVLMPPIITGGVLTVALAARGDYELLPAMWLLLYGTALAVGGVFAVRLVPVMGGSFMLLGTLASVAPLHIGNLLLAVGFGVLHIVFGVLVIRRYGG